MKTDLNLISWDYPDTLQDEHGYPTDAALDYIKNWGIHYGWKDGETKVGKYFGIEEEFERLIDYLKSIWWVAEDGITYEDGLLELHTFGWSGNEDIIRELQDTTLFITKFSAKTAGGHYYFKINGESEYDWHIVKSKDK